MAFFTLGKVLLALLWGLALMALVFPAHAVGGEFLLKAALVTLAIHVLELLFVDGRLRCLPSVWGHRLQVLLFGYFHWGRLSKVDVDGA